MVQVDKQGRPVPPDKDVNNPHNNIKIVLRFRFKKIGKLQYVSHLDLVRTMNKIIVRSGLPLYYTEGFNPKPKMTFAAPLSIGTESYAEYMDIRLVDRIDPKLAMERLNANMTDEMQVFEAYYPETKFTEMKWLRYDITLCTKGASEALAAKCESILTSDTLEILKSTKSGEKITDIRPLIKSARANYDDGVIRLECVLCADQSTFLNPEYIIKALKEKVGILSESDLTSEHYSIVRRFAYTDDMTEFR